MVPAVVPSGAQCPAQRRSRAQRRPVRERSWSTRWDDPGRDAPPSAEPCPPMAGFPVEDPFELVRVLCGAACTGGEVPGLAGKHLLHNAQTAPAQQEIAQHIRNGVQGSRQRRIHVTLRIDLIVDVPDHPEKIG